LHRMKRLFLLPVLLALICSALDFSAPPVHASAAAAPSLSAKSYFIMEAETGGVVSQYNSDERLGMASTTKIMTALVAIEQGDLSAIVTIKREWAGVEGSSIYLKTGQTISLENLLYGLMLESGNDAATAIAGFIGGSNEAFAVLMNKKAEELGLKDTHYVNPHGLDASDHYTTARDLAVLMRAAMQNPKFAEIAGTKYWNYGGQSWKNHNELLFNNIGCLAGKTGYTKSTGRSLVSVAERNGMRFIITTLGDPNDWNDHTAAYNWVFSIYKRYEFTDSTLKDYVIPVVGGITDRVSLTLNGNPIGYTLPVELKVTATPEIPKFTYAVVVKGALAGYLSIDVEGRTPIKVPLYYGETVLRRGGVKAHTIYPMSYPVISSSGFIVQAAREPILSYLTRFTYGF